MYMVNITIHVYTIISKTIYVYTMVGITIYVYVIYMIIYLKSLIVYI